MSNPIGSNARRGAHTMVALLLSLALAVTGCASVHPLPAGFAAEAARFEAGTDAPPTVVVEGPASKVGGALRGLAWGGGIGLVVGLAMESGCAFTCGVASALGGLIGIGSGVIGGAIASEREAEVDAKRELLTAAFAAQPHTQRLVDALRAGAAPASGSPDWAATVGIVGIETVGHGRDVPWRLRVRARLALRPAGASEAAAVLDFDALSPAAWPTPAWQADGGRPLREALDDCLRSLAAQMLTALHRAPPHAEVPALPSTA